MRTIEVAELEAQIAAVEKNLSPAEKNPKSSDGKNSMLIRSTREILIYAEENECYDLEFQPGAEGDKIRAELRRQNAAHEAQLRELRATGATK